MPKTVKEIPISHWNMPNLLRSWKPQKRYYWCPKAYAGWAGLGLHFQASGRVNWVCYYNIPGQPKRVAVLGELHPQSFRYQEAEAAGRAIREAAKRGVDLVAEKRVSRETAGDVREMGERYLEEWAYPRKRSAFQDERFLRTHVFPAIGSMQPAAVEYGDVYPIVKAFADAGHPGMADLCKAIISKLFNWGVGPYKIKHNPALGIPAFNARPVEDEDYGALPLSLDQVGLFWRGLDDLGAEPVTGLYARFLMLTGVRPVEAAGMRTDEMAKDDVWVVPAARMKKGRAHRVPLSDLAKEIVDDARKLGPGGPFVFTGYGSAGKKPLTTSPLRAAMRTKADKLGLLPGQSPYSLRKFVATTIGGFCHPGTGIRYDDDDVGFILAHKRRSITSVYNQEKYDDFKRVMLQQLADEVRKRI